MTPDNSDHKVIRNTGSVLLALGAAAVVGALIFGIVTKTDSEAPDDAATPSATASATPSPSVQRASFVTASGQDLMLDGKQFRYAGANAYTLPFESPTNVAVYMKVAKESNLTVMRTWGFYDIGTPDGDLTLDSTTRGVYFQYWDAEAGAPAFNDTETGLVHLDQVIASASQNGIKLVLPLVNNWTAFGGIDQYVRWAGGTYHDDFFTNETIKSWYKAWVEHVLNRTNSITGIKYKDDPTILTWELGNELRCSESGPYPSSDACGSDMIVAWADEMSQYVRSIDTNHLIGFGGEGFLCTDPGGPTWWNNCKESADPVALLALKDIDIHGIHVYPNHWQPTEPTSDWEDWGAWWIDEQGAIAADANKPYYIGEYGWVDRTERMLVFDNWLQHFYDAGGDGSLFWLMQPAVSIAADADGVGFTQRCPGAACDLVSAWSQHVNQGVEWSEIGPISDADFAFLEPDGTATLDVLANDKVFAPATWDLTSIDLDPATDGVQTTITKDGGTFTVVDGKVTYVSAADPAGARCSYTVADSEGRVTTERQISVTPKS